ATSSSRDMTLHVLRALDVERSLDLELTREDVEKPKPKAKTVIVRRMIVQPVTRAVTKDRSASLGVALEDPTLPKMLDMILGKNGESNDGN
ncbi:MAG: hypothetical protein QQN63_13595, partial [Nitrosopumilus sp.]